MKLLVLSGGRHAYQESTPILGNFLRKASHEVTVTEDAAGLAHATHLAGYDTLVFNTRREALPALPDPILSTGEQDGLKNFIRSGKVFVSPHLHLSAQGLARISCDHRRGTDHWHKFASAL